MIVADDQCNSLHMSNLKVALAENPLGQPFGEISGVVRVVLPAETSLPALKSIDLQNDLLYKDGTFRKL